MTLHQPHYFGLVSYSATHQTMEDMPCPPNKLSTRARRILVHNCDIKFQCGCSFYGIQFSYKKDSLSVSLPPQVNFDECL